MRSRAWSFFAAMLIAAIACGKNVDLGGATDAGAGDNDEPDDCDPCATAAECQANAACAQIGGDTFCALMCTTTSGCGEGESCRAATTATGEHITACLPAGGTCVPAPPPTNADAGSCGDLAGPTIVAKCTSCGKYSDDCQKNGCYGGWWCDTATRDCRRPPTHCN